MALYRVPTQNNSQYTLDSQLAQGGTSLTLNQSVAGVVRAPGVCVIDRIDSSGSKTASKREYVSFTGVSGAQLTGITRGLAGSTDQVHAVGAIVEFTPDVIQEQGWYDWATLEHTADGVHASLPSLTLLRSVNGVFASTVSTNLVNTNQLIANTYLQASGASIVGFPVRPVFRFTLASAATTAIGAAMDMPVPGTINFISVTLNAPVSGGSLVFDVNKNFTTMFTDQNTRLGILGGGTFASTASIAVRSWAQSDKLSVDLDQGGSNVPASVQISAR